MNNKVKFQVAGTVCGLVVLCIVLASAIPTAKAPSKETALAPAPPKQDLADTQSFELDQFIDPETCGGCHDEIMEQWQGSMHNLSHKDPVYSRVAKFLIQGLTDAGEIEEAESCVKCHTPVGYVTGFPAKTSDELTRTAEIPAQGIQCDYCHSAIDVTRMYNNGLVLEPGHGEDDPGTKHGPFDDAEPDFHDAAFSKLHTDSKICGTCHNVKHVAFDTDLETTYTEWENSPYNSKDPEKFISCQGCHMYQRPGVPATASTPRPENPGSAALGAMERPHIFTHNFVGGNSGVPGMFSAPNESDKSTMAQERLKHAAEISVVMKDDHTAWVVVANTGAGHTLPTGVSDLRQVWVELTLKDRRGKVLYQSGVLDKNSELPLDTVIFKTTFGDGHGNPEINMAKAREILSDTRIPAGKSASHEFDLKAKPKKGSTLTARLLYRSMPQKILNMLPGEKIGPLPVVEMAVAQENF